MKKTVSLMLAAFLLIASGEYAQCSKKDSIAKKTEYRKIPAEEAKKILDTNANAILLDVRTESEFVEKHISGAILLPLSEMEEKAAERLPDKNALILVYCRSGVRSKNAANLLISMGYIHVYDMGGIINWPYDTCESGITSKTQ